MSKRRINPAGPQPSGQPAPGALPAGERFDPDFDRDPHEDETADAAQEESAQEEPGDVRLEPKPEDQSALSEPEEFTERPEAVPPTAPEPANTGNLPHEPSGKTCTLINHYDGYGACIICLHCQKKVRPQDMDKPCPARM